MEILEPRRLFAQTTLTLHGGDVFEFEDAAGNIEKVQLYGNITAQLIGAQVDGSNDVHLVNLPGDLDGLPVNGGIGTPTGVQVIGTITITDPFDAAGNTSTPAIQALASNGSELYAINYLSVASSTGGVTQTFVQLVEINTSTAVGTVIAELGSQVNAGLAPLNGTVSGVPTAAFDPANGLLYFVATAGTANVPKLFSVNLNAGSAIAIENSVSAVPGSFSIAANSSTVSGNTTSPITAIAFDGSGNLIAAGNVTGGSSSSDPYIFSVSLGNTNQITNSYPITESGTAVAGPVEGLAYYTGQTNPVAIAGTGSSAQVLSVSTSNGDAIPYGALADGQTGENPGGLTLDTGLTDPFSGQTGALLATDTATHQLYYVDPLNRIEANYIWSFYVSESDDTGKIVVSEETELGGTDTPFTGSVGSIRVINAQTGDLNLISAPTDSGEVLIGALSRHIDPNSTTDDDIPFLSATVSSGIDYGVLPASYTTLTPGLIVASGNTLNDFQVGGTVTGDVTIGGAIDTFYAGWLITGDADGELQGDVSYPDNFVVDGELRDLIVEASIGTDSDADLTEPTYLSGFDMHVLGTLGNVHSYGSIVGSINADDDPDYPSLNTDQQEIEDKSADGSSPWDEGELGGDPPGTTASSSIFNNDTFATAQYVTGEDDASAGLDGAVVVDGTLQDDSVVQEKVDYYAVSLLAGETITAVVHQLTAGSLVLDLGVFDPSGREVYSDYNQVDMAATQQQPIHFTADEPGVWRFAVAVTGDGTFSSTGGSIIDQDVPYKLTIQGVGDTGVGNIVAADNIFDEPVDGSPGFGDLLGDFGSLEAGGDIVSLSGDTVSVADGNLRVIQWGTMGDGATADPEISVPGGSVGLVSTTTGDMFFNYPLLPESIGGTWQVVSSAGNFAAKLLAEGSIGTIEAASMTTAVSYFEVNTADSTTTPGTIDLIDVTGDFGTITDGGPHIITGPDGNVRYIHVGGTVYQDSTFGGGSPTGTEYQYGETADLTDDSGSLVDITPEPLVSTTIVTTAASSSTTTTAGTTTTTTTNSDGSATTSTVVVVENSDGSFTTTTTDSTTAQLTITAYGIEGSGGLAIIKVASTGGVTVNGSAGANGLPNQTAEIAEIDTTGTGTSTIAGTSTSSTKSQTVSIDAAPQLSSTGDSLDVVLAGSIKLDLMDVVGGNFTSIVNETDGEIDDVDATSIGTLKSGGSIGVMSSNTAAAVQPIAVEADTFPFDQQHNAIVVGGGYSTSGTSSSQDDIVTVSAPVIGNIDVNGSIGSLSGTIEAPVVAGAQINAISIGSGIMASGSGNLSRAGIYAGGAIGSITNTTAADIRGNIVSSVGILSLSLKNGSIINARIEDSADFADTAEPVAATDITDTLSPITNPTLDLGSLTVTGNGGIIGTLLAFHHTGTITVAGGFGIFETLMDTLGDGTVQSISADGYGIRDTSWVGGASIGSIIANGNGSLDSTVNFSGDVRLSETDTYDPYFDFEPNVLTDIHEVLGTSASTPVIAGVTDTGIIENDDFRGDRSLTSVKAYQIRSTNPAIDPTVFNFSPPQQNLWASSGSGSCPS